VKIIFSNPLAGDGGKASFVREPCMHRSSPNPSVFPMKRSILSSFAYRCAALVSLACAASQSHAASATWTGAGSDALWSNPANWSTTPVPGTGDTATFNAAAGAGGKIIDLGSGATVNTISVVGPNFDDYTIGAGGANAQTLVLNGSGNAGLSSSGTASTKQITINAAITVNNSQQWILSQGANPWIINGNVTTNGSAGSTIEIKNNGRNVQFNGVLSDQPGGAKLRIAGANGASTMILTNSNNSFTGGLYFDNGGVSVNTIGMIGSNSAAGAGGDLLFGSGFGGGTFTYTGTGDTTNRVVRINHGYHGATITQSGTSGLLKFNADMDFSAASTAVGSATITLQGSAMGEGEFEGKIIDHPTSGFTPLKSAVSTGATSLNLNSVDGIAIGAQVTGSGIDAATTVTAVNTVTKTITISPGTLAGIAQNANITVTGLVNITRITKKGTGIWSLSGANTFSGLTTIEQGNLRINSLNNIASPNASSSLGRPTTAFHGTIAIGNGGNAGQLTYLGSGETTDRVINLAGTTGGATLDQSGTGLLKFTSHFTATGAGAKTLTLQGSTNGSGEIAAAIVNSSSATALTKTGSGTWTLSGANAYNGLTTISGGTLRIDASTGSLNGTSGTALTFIGSGRFHYDTTTASGAKSQTMGALTFTAGEGIVQNPLGAASSSTLGFANSPTRPAGASANFISGGADAVSHKITLTGAATGTLLNQGFYFNGSHFATYDTGGYIRALNYATSGGDTNTVNVDAITASRHVKLTTAPAAQNTITLLSLNLAGNGVNWTQNAAQTLTCPTILKAGGGTSTISGGTALTAGTNTELLIRADFASDTLDIAVPLTQGSGALTKSGAGALILSATGSTFSGPTHVNNGTLQVNGSITGSGAITVRTGATLGGSGSVAGATTVQIGGSIQPSISGSTGNTLTLTNAIAPTLNAGSIFKLRAPSATVDKIIFSNATTLNIAGTDLVIDTTGLIGNHSALTIVQNAGTITGPFRSVTVTGNTDYIATLDYGTPGEVKLSLTNSLSAPSAYQIQVAGNNNATMTAGDALNLTVTALNPSGTALSTFTGNVTLSFYGLAASPNSTAPALTDKDGITRSVSASVGTPNATLSFVNGVATVSGVNNGVLTASHAAIATLHCSDSVATSASGTGAAGLSLTVNPAAIAAYNVGVTSPQVTSVIFPTTVSAIDAFGNTVSTDSSTVVTMTSSGSAQFDSNGDGTFGDNAKTLVNGTFTINTKNDSVETITLTATSAGGKTGTSSAITFNASSAKDILTFDFPVHGAAVISGTNITKTLPSGSSVTNLAPTYTVTGGATGDPVSGTARNFTTPQTYTITALDNSTKVYTVTVTVAPTPTTFTWASATTGVWSNAARWTNNVGDGTAPVATGAANYTLNFTPTGTYTATHDRNNGFLLNQANFSGTPTVDGTNALTFTNNGATLPAIHHNSNNNTTLSTPIVLNANTTVGGTATGNATFTLNGAISGSGTLIKENTAILTLNSASTYSGGTTVNAGTLRLGGTNNTLMGSGPVTLNAGTTLNLNGNNNLTNAFAINGATVTNGNSFSANLNGPVTLTGSNIFDLATTGNMSIGGAISGSGGLTRRGTSSGTLNITGANSFTGPVAVQAGSITVTSLNSVIGGTATSNLGAPTTGENGTISLGLTTTAGSLIYNGTGETTDRVIRLSGTTGGATITQGGNAYLPTTRGQTGLLKLTSNISIPGTAGVDNRKTLTLSNAPKAATGSTCGSGEISGSIGDSLLGSAGQTATSITKTGSGTWILSGSNTYSGSTSVQAGTLAITRANALGAGAVVISSGASMRLDYIGTRQVASLSFPNYSGPGTYGSTASLATYKDDTYFSGPGTITIGALPGSSVALVLSSGGNPSNGGGAVTFTATVTGASPTGTVFFYDGLTPLAAVTLNASSQASFTTTLLTGGNHSITAVYSGDTNNGVAYSAALSHSVNDTRPASTTTLARTSGSNPSAFGTSVTYTATVSGSAPTGSVAFYDGTTLLATSPLNGSAQATLTTSGLAVGWRPLRAAYLGNITNAPSSAATLFHAVNPPPGNGKTKVFILAGQSNMQGKAAVEIGRNPNNPSDTNFSGGFGSLRFLLNKLPDQYGYLADPANPAGSNPGWIKRSDVSVTYWSGGGANDVPNPTSPARVGDLDPFFGNNGEGPTGVNGRIGPEYSFGLVVGSQLGDPVLILKYAFGGKSLGGEFRPPSAVSKRGGTVGAYYTGMVARVNAALSALPVNSYEIAGFAWHQGWNDRSSTAFANEYEANMADLIRDLRVAWNVPNMPVTIGTTGMANADQSVDGVKVINAQAAVANPALYPEFAGTVVTVDTRPFDYGNDAGGNNDGYHWNHNAESYFNVGEQMALRLMPLLSSQSSAKDILSFSIPGQLSSNISGNTITVTMPAGTNRSALSPDFSVSSLATALPLTGTARDFTVPQTYTVTAQNLTTQTYTVNIVESATTPYQDWAATHAPSGTAADDFDGDGVSNGIEFYLGGDKNTNDLAKLPQMTTTATHWVFSFTRKRSSVPGVSSCVIEVGDTLTTWPGQYLVDSATPGITIEENTPTDFDKITLSIPKNAAPQTFARLKLTVIQP
jgi:autotransporter-associated beta strand protein